MRVPFFSWNLKWDPDLENYSHMFALARLDDGLDGLKCGVQLLTHRFVGT